MLFFPLTGYFYNVPNNNNRYGRQQFTTTAHMKIWKEKKLQKYFLERNYGLSRKHFNLLARYGLHRTALTHSFTLANRLKVLSLQRHETKSIYHHVNYDYYFLSSLALFLPSSGQKNVVFSDVFPFSFFLSSIYDIFALFFIA